MKSDLEEESTTAQQSDTPAPYNPEADGHPAKLWEALRRNERFRATAGRVVALATSKEPDNRLTAENIISWVSRTNSCAAAALQWLCPDAAFIFTHCRKVDGTDQDGKPCKFHLQWRGTSPDLPPLSDPAWQVQDGKPNAGGLPMRVGPLVWQTDLDPVDSFQQWREDKARLPSFTVDCAWPDTPRLFRSDLSFRWRHFEHGINPHTGRPDFLLSARETRFFEGWNLEDFDSSRHAGLVKVLEFNELARCRVFAIRKLRYASASEIDEMLQAISARLKADLVCKGEILGTKTQWDVFLAVERNRAEREHNGEQFSIDAAIDEAGEMLYADKYDAQHRKEIVLGYWRAMDASGSSPGWIQKTFPRLHRDILPIG